MGLERACTLVTPPLLSSPPRSTTASDKDSVKAANQLEGREKRCYKCGKWAILRCREFACKDCFLQAINRAFRSNLRTKCLNSGKCQRGVAIWFTGDFNSASLLHLLLNRNFNRHFPTTSTTVSTVTASNRAGVNSTTTGSSGPNDPKATTSTTTTGSEGGEPLPTAKRQLVEAVGTSLERLLTSDDIKLKLIINIDPLTSSSSSSSSTTTTTTRSSRGIGDGGVDNPFLERGNSYFSLVQSVFSTFNLNLTPRTVVKDYLIEYQLEHLKVVYLKPCLFFHVTTTSSGTTTTTIRERCNEDCSSFTSKLTTSFLSNQDLQTHFWDTIRYINLKYYLITTNSTTATNTTTTRSSASSNSCSLDSLIEPDNIENISRRTIFQTCIGNGAVVHFKSSFRDAQTLDKLTLLRPLKSISSKELFFYHKLAVSPTTTTASTITGSNRAAVSSSTTTASSSEGRIMRHIGLFLDELEGRHSNLYFNISNVTNHLISPPPPTSTGSANSSNSSGGRGPYCTICNITTTTTSSTTTSGTKLEICRGCNYLRVGLGDLFELIASHAQS